MQQTDLKNEHVQAAEWEKATCLQELDITATDLSKECLMDVLTRIPSIRWLSIGQQDGMTDSVMKVFFIKALFSSLVKRWTWASRGHYLAILK